MIQKTSTAAVGLDGVYGSLDDRGAAQNQKKRFLRMNSHLPEDCAEMIANGALTDVQHRCDRAHSHSIAQETDHFPLSRGEVGARKYRLVRPALVAVRSKEPCCTDLLGDLPQALLQLDRSACFAGGVENRRVSEDEGEAAVATRSARKEKRGHANPSSLRVARAETQGAAYARAPHPLSSDNEVGDVIWVDMLEQRRTDHELRLVTENSGHLGADMSHAPVVVGPAENER